MTKLHHVNEAGDAAVKQLPTADATELAHAIQGVVDLIRTQEDAT